jgi:phage terminase large subunit
MATLAERAQLLIDAAKDPLKQAAHIELCKRDPKYFFNNFVYTFDPRDSKGAIPFNLYPFQEWFIDTLREKIDQQTDIDIEKSRTMGASWMLMGLFLWYWLFIPSSSFLIGSITEQDVDMNLVDPEDTLFGKLRFILEYIPPWMAPKDYTDKHLTLKNNENGNVISGKAPTSNFGRGSRKKAILFDEVAFWQWARAAHASASQTTKCRIMNSTSNGKFGVYGEAMTKPGRKRLTWPGREAMAKAKGLHE